MDVFIVVFVKMEFGCVDMEMVVFLVVDGFVVELVLLLVILGILGVESYVSIKM